MSRRFQRVSASARKAAKVQMRRISCQLVRAFSFASRCYAQTHIAVVPAARCRLKLLKLERVKDYLLMEAEFIQNQERLKPQEERQEEERTKVDDLRGTPMAVGNLEEIIDDQHAIVSTVNLKVYSFSSL